MPMKKFFIAAQNSWLNPKLNEEKQVTESEGACLSQVFAGPANQSDRAAIDLRLNTLSFKSKDYGQTQSAWCRTEIKLNYKPGFAFSIRKVTIPLKFQSKSDVTAQFKGTYGIDGINQFDLAQNLGESLAVKSIHLESGAPAQNIIWSNCSGVAHLIIDTELSFNSSRLVQNPWTQASTDPDLAARADDFGSFSIDTAAPYRLEILWAKCR